MTMAPNISFHGTPTRALRGLGPVNSNRWRGASRRPNGEGVHACPVSGAAPANRSFKLTDACSSRTPGVRPRSSAAA